MPITIQHVNPLATRVYMGTLTEGETLHQAFADIATNLAFTAATFELLGGLTEVEFTAYDFVAKERMPAITHTGAMEIVAAHGTISLLDHQPHVHTHLTVAYRDPAAPNGIAILAGHAARAVVFAVEFTLTAYDGAPVHRALDTATGLNLWHLPPLS